MSNEHSANGSASAFITSAGGKLNLVSFGVLFAGVGLATMLGAAASTLALSVLAIASMSLAIISNSFTLADHGRGLLWGLVLWPLLVWALFLAMLVGITYTPKIGYIALPVGILMAALALWPARE